MDVNNWNNVVQIILGIAGSSGILITAYKLLKKYIFSPVLSHFDKISKNYKQLNELSEQFNKTVLPIIESLNKEFNLNSVTQCYIRSTLNHPYKDTQSLISVLTTSYHSGDKILRPYHSLLNQNYKNWEWVIRSTY